MNSSRIALALLCALALLGCTTQEYDGSRIGKTSEWTVTRIIDGDTLVAEKDGITEHVRLLGVDFPDTTTNRIGKWLDMGLSEDRVHTCHSQGIEDVRKMLQGQKVNLTTDSSQRDKDKYGRLLRYVELGSSEQDLGAWLIISGYAIRLAEYPCHKCDEYGDTEFRTKEMMRGCLWAVEEEK